MKTGGVSILRNPATKSELGENEGYRDSKRDRDQGCNLFTQVQDFNPPPQDDKAQTILHCIDQR